MASSAAAASPISEACTADLPERVAKQQRATARLDREADSLHRFEIQRLVRENCARILQCLANVLFLQIGIIETHLLAAAVRGENLEHAPHCDTHSADTRLPVHLRGVDRDSIKHRYIVR